MTIFDPGAPLEDETPLPMLLVSASANRDKIAEIDAILGDDFVVGTRPVGLGEVEEDGETLEENARLKARAVAEWVGEPAVADDTGLEVDALDGAPGVRSARYAGEAATYEDNVAKLVEALAEAGAEDPAARRARFRTVAMVRFPGGDEVVTDGVVEGHISTEPRGEGGFGYDPVFVPDEGDGRTFAEMSAEEKNAISHRGRAFRALARALLELPDPAG